MTEPRLAKSWKVTEIMLRQASDFLLEPGRIAIPEQSLDNYKNYLQVNELELAMLELEQTAREHGAKSSFWRRLRKAAQEMKLDNKVAEYESEFHKALSRSDD